MSAADRFSEFRELPHDFDRVPTWTGDLAVSFRGRVLGVMNGHLVVETPLGNLLLYLEDVVAVDPSGEEEWIITVGPDAHCRLATTVRYIRQLFSGRIVYQPW